MITQSEAPAPEKILVQKHLSDKSAMLRATVGIGLTGGRRASVTPGKIIPEK